MGSVKKQAVVMLSGGLDSATTLAYALDAGFDCYALSFFYGQRHCSELDAAKRVADFMGVKEHRVIEIALGAFGGSALTDKSLSVPTEPQEGIPITYVPARNTIFLSYALGWAEVLGVGDIFLGVNAVDYSGYPDCRPEYLAAFETMANLATKQGVEGQGFKIHAPLIDLSKAAIIELGVSLGVNYRQTVSCYMADELGRACGCCESCRLRREGFEQAGIDDLTQYC